MIKTDIKINENIPYMLLPFLLPVTEYDLTFREFGESPVFKSVGTLITLATGASVICSSGMIIRDLFTSKETFSVKKSVVEGMKAGCSFGAQIALSELVTETMANFRGRESFYDTLISGAITGAVFSIHKGGKGMIDGAIRGVLLSSLLSGVKFASGYANS